MAGWGGRIQGYCAKLPGAVPQSIRYLPEHPLFSETRCSPSASSRESAHAGNLLSRPPHRKRSEWGWAWGVRGGGRLNYACLSGCLTRCEEQTLWKAGRREKRAGNDPFLPSCLPNLLCVKQPDMQARSVRFPPAFSAGSGSYDLSEIRRLGIRAEKAAWRAWGSARASRAVFRALAEYTRRPKAFRMPVDARCAARGARHGTRGARAPHARRSASHSSR